IDHCQFHIAHCFAGGLSPLLLPASQWAMRNAQCAMVLQNPDRLKTGLKTELKTENSNAKHIHLSTRNKAPSHLSGRGAVGFDRSFQPYAGHTTTGAIGRVEVRGY